MKRDEYKMTQQVDTTDYKQKYEQALERAKKGECIENIFPELRESEDEKWRKWLIGHLKGYINQTDDKYAEVCKKAIAWLEKQGEQQPADNIESSAFKDKLLELFQKFRYIKEGIPTNGDIIEYIDAHIQELIDTLQNKPWSEEDEKMLEDTISCLSAYQSPDISKGLCYQEQIDWLKSIKPNHWKPSEQNIKDLEWCADLVKDKMGVGFHRLQVFIDELKSL